MHSNNINYPYISNTSSFSNYKTTKYNPYSQDRFVTGGFLAPFVLGGITGGLLAPAFYPPRVYPAPPPVYPYPAVYPVYIR